MFKEKFKYYKKKSPSPCLADVLNMKSPNRHVLSEIPLNCSDAQIEKCSEYGLRNPLTWQVYELKSCPGFYYVVDPFTSPGQRYWISRSLADYPNKPSITNIDNQEDVKLILDDSTWWEVVSRRGGFIKLRNNLRWATMGYHHNWDTKVYSESLKTAFPEDLNALCQYLIKVIFNDNFRAEACIVNFYHMDSSLSGHSDRSEPNVQAPLISFSFGQTAIFLLGGLTLDDPPYAIAIESGDVAIMTGESRLRYHGVPKILPTLYQPWNDFQRKENFDLNSEAYPVTCRNINDPIHWKPFLDYVKTSRININVRQVLFPNQLNLCHKPC